MLTVESAHGVIVIHVNEPVLLSELEILDQMVLGLHKPQLLLDLSGAESVSSRLISILARLHDQVKAAGGRLALWGLGPDLAPVFENTGLNKVMSLFTHEGEAMASFGVRNAGGPVSGRRETGGDRFS